MKTAIDFYERGKLIRIEITPRRKRAASGVYESTESI